MGIILSGMLLRFTWQVLMDVNEGEFAGEKAGGGGVMQGHKSRNQLALRRKIAACYGKR